MTRPFCKVSSSGMSCQFCGKAFNRVFNLRRHENEYCPLKSEEREMSETESRTVDLEDDASSVATDGSQSSMTGKDTSADYRRSQRKSVLCQLCKDSGETKRPHCYKCGSIEHMTGLVFEEFTWN